MPAQDIMVEIHRHANNGMNSKVSKRPSTLLAGGLRCASLSECLEFLPPVERALTEQLRDPLLAEAPELQERLSFNVPFYKVRKVICFRWPATASR